MLATELLGVAPDARVLIVNADDLGMRPSITTAVLESIDRGIVRSTSLMTVCPGSAHALALLRDRPDVAFGVHLTLVRDRPSDRWRPLGPAGSVVDGDGLFPVHARAGDVLAEARVDDVEREFRAQLGAVLDAGLAPTHLDFHGVADGGRDDVWEMTADLAREHGLALRVWLQPGRSRARAAGLPVVDHPFLDSFSIDVGRKAEQYASLLRALPPGLSEWAVHPGPGDGPAHDATVRRGDLEFLTSARAREIVADEGIELIDYRPLQRLWSTTG